MKAGRMAEGGWMKAAGCVAVLVVMAVGAVGGTLEEPRAWAADVGRQAADAELRKLGLADAGAREAVLASWDEDVAVEAAVSNRAYELMGWLVAKGGLSREGRQKIRDGVLAVDPTPVGVVDLAWAYPVAERGDFEAAMRSVAPKRFSTAPVYGDAVITHNILRGVPVLSADVPEADLVRVLLAVEHMPLSHAQSCKAALKERAVRLARERLRAEGKSFVVQNGVNPLVELVQPVIDALNAPGCAGLEAAFRGLGSDVADVDRAALGAAAVGWQAEVMSGERSGAAVTAILGKLAVALGPDAYNAFVDAYNNGTGDGG
jgi:hypothetical protein